MVKIEIEHCGKLSNVDALAFCHQYIVENYVNRRDENHSYTRIMTRESSGKELSARVTESPLDTDNPSCSVTFKVEKIEQINDEEFIKMSDQVNNADDFVKWVQEESEKIKKMNSVESIKK